MQRQANHALMVHRIFWHEGPADARSDHGQCPVVALAPIGGLALDVLGGKDRVGITGEFTVVGPDWPDHFPDLTLGMPWLRENGANFDMHNSLLTIDDNFTIPFEKVNYISTLSDSQIRAMTDFPSPTYSPE